MTNTTANYGFQIPEAAGTDYMSPDLWRVPITAIDTALKSLSNEVAALQTVGAEDITAIVGAGTIGYSVESAKARRIGKIAMIEILIKRTGADVAAGGNILNVALTAALPAGDWRPVMPVALGNGPYGGGVYAYLETNMQVILTALVLTWPQDIVQSFHATYFTV